MNPKHNLGFGETLSDRGSSLIRVLYGCAQRTMMLVATECGYKGSEYSRGQAMITRDLQFVQWLLSCLVCGVVKAAAISGMSFNRLMVAQIKLCDK